MAGMAGMAGMASPHGSTWAPGDWNGAVPVFCVQKVPGKDGEGRMAKLKWLDKYCNECGNQLNSWDSRLSKALAYKYPCCESCIAVEYGMTADRLRDCMEDYFGIRPCMGI